MTTPRTSLQPTAIIVPKGLAARRTAAVGARSAASCAAVALALCAAASTLAAAPALAADVGRFAIVQKQVTSLKPGAAAAVPAVAGAAIVFDEQESTGPASAAKMTFGEGAVISLGQNTTFKVSRQAVEEATGASTSTVDLVVGKARVFVSRFWSGRPEVRVNTPTAVVGVKGSEVAIEVFENGSTLVTVLTGSAWVEPKADAGGRRELTSGSQSRTDASGRFEGTAVVAPASEIADVRARTEADPVAPRELPGGKALVAAPSDRGGRAPADGRKARSGGIQTNGPSSGGTVWTDPAVGAVPDPVVVPEREPQ